MVLMQLHFTQGPRRSHAVIRCIVLEFELHVWLVEG